MPSKKKLNYGDLRGAMDTRDAAIRQIHEAKYQQMEAEAHIATTLFKEGRTDLLSVNWRKLTRELHG